MPSSQDLDVNAHFGIPLSSETLFLPSIPLPIFFKSLAMSLVALLTKILAVSLSFFIRCFPNPCPILSSLLVALSYPCPHYSYIYSC